MLDTVKINHVQHISFTQSRLTDAVSVILSELLSYEHPSKWKGFLIRVLKKFVLWALVYVLKYMIPIQSRNTNNLLINEAYSVVLS